MKAIEIYTDMGRFSIAAKHHQTIAEMYEGEANDLVKIFIQSDSMNEKNFLMKFSHDYSNELFNIMKKQPIISEVKSPLVQPINVWSRLLSMQLNWKTMIRRSRYMNRWVADWTEIIGPSITISHVCCFAGCQFMSWQLFTQIQRQRILFPCIVMSLERWFVERSACIRKILSTISSISRFQRIQVG